MTLRTVKVPIELCAYCASHNKENQQRLFLVLKLLCPEGKTKLNKDDFITLALALGYRSTKPVKRLIKDLVKDNWLRYNSKTEYYIVVSFDKLLNIKYYHYGTAIECSLKNLNNVKAFNGAALFTFLYRNHWGRKKKQAKSERKKGRSSHFRGKSSPSFKKQYAPIALAGVQSIYDISITKIKEMKKEAQKEGYIRVKHHFNIINATGAKGKHLSMNGDTIIQGAQKAYIKYPDLIMPLIPVKRRRKYATYKRI